MSDSPEIQRSRLGILHLIDIYFPIMRGYSARSHYILSNQIKLGLKPIVITSPNHNNKKFLSYSHGVKFYSTNLRKNLLPLSIPGFWEFRFIDVVYKKILEVARSEKIGLIHAHSPSLLGLAGVLASKRLGLKLVYEIRAFWEDAAVSSNKYSQYSLKYKIVRALETIVCKYADRVVTISNGMKSELIARGLPEEKLIVIPNGVDHKFFKDIEGNCKLRLDLGLKSKLVFGYIGSFFDFEGIDDLVHAFANLCQKEKHVALLLLGGGEKETFIKQEINRLGIDSIIYAGKVPHEKIMDYYKVIDVMVYPRKSSRLTELTTPLKPLEAMALGKPIICSSVGGLTELIGENNALFFKAGNLDELINHCLDLINNPFKRKILGENGIRRAFLEKQWDKNIRKYLKIYDSLSEEIS